MIYKWKPFTNVSVDAQSAGEEINRLIEHNEGQVTPSIVVKAATAKRNPLHPAFEWDDKIAARMQREDRARYLLRNIVVVTQKKDQEQEEKVIRAFVHVASAESYSAIAKVMSDEDMRNETLERARKELQDWYDRYEDFVEFSKLLPMIKEHLIHGGPSGPSFLAG